MPEGNTISLDQPVALLGAEQHEYAADQLRSAWPEVTWIEIANGAAAPDNSPVIELHSDDTKSDGEFEVSISAEHGPRIVIAGAPYSGVIYGADELGRMRSTTVNGVVHVPASGFRGAPGLPYSTFWTWDHSTNWELSQIGFQEIGVFNTYSKPPSGFVKDYKRVVDFCARNRIAAIVIYGFLRDSHGGIAAAQELCKYAKRRGVRIIPGIAIGAYGGVYWEGSHQYNLSTWLHANPDLSSDMERGVGFQLKDLGFPLNFPRSDYTMHACPSRAENMDWMEDAVSWLVETFDVGGVNIEAGDYGVCGCDRCRRRRGARESATRRSGDDTEFWSHADMADNFPRLYNAAKNARSDIWVYCELQWDNILDESAHAPLSNMPDDAIYQHTVNKSYWNEHLDDLSSEVIRSLPTRTNVLRSQFACQWNGDERTERYALNGPVFSEMTRRCFEIGMNGLTVWGEPSPYNAATEFSYIAFARGSFDPSLTWPDIVEQEIAPRLGNRNDADWFIDKITLLDRQRSLPTRTLMNISREAIERADEAMNEQVLRRWLSLAEVASRRLYMGQ